MSDEIKQRIGDYEVLSVLGSGGMGRVYKVRNVISDRVEAMKILLPNLAGRQELADRFLKEIKLLASLDHPNIAALRTALTVENQLLMIMEYVEGTTLAARLEHGPIPVGETLDYINQVLAALSYAHARGVIHRDIKPGNMMLTPGGVVKLMDFGIARSGPDGGMTKTGTTLGSVHYMSPEQVRCEPIDARSDLYSLGISLYELVTGQRPFQADSEFSLMAAQVKEIPKPPLQLQAGLPAGLNEIILMAIEKDPAKRFQSAEAFRNALSNVAYDSSGVTATIDVKAPVIAPAVGTAAAKVTPTAARPQTASAAPSPSATAAAPRVATGVGVAAGAGASAAASAGAAANVPPGKNDHHVLYITLGAVLALAALVGAGTYVSARRGRANQGGSMFGGKSTPAPSAAPDSAPAPTQTPDANSSPAATQTQTPATGDGGVPADANASGNTAPGAAPAETKSAGGSSAAASHTGGRNSGATKGATSQAEQKAANDQAAAAAAAAAAASAAAEKEKLDQLEMSIDQLQSRIDAVNNSLEGIEQEQSRSGMRMRSDITAARSAMLNSLKKAQDAVADHDAERAKRYSDQAEANLEIIEKFLGRR